MPARQLDFRTLNEAIAEIERLRSGGYTRTGNWNLTQVCEHLTATMRLGMDGGMRPLPWALRATVLRLVVARILRTRRMPTGAGTLPSLVPHEARYDDDATIDMCLATLSEARDFAGPLPTYPLSTGIDLEKWRDLMCVHAAHHLGFLLPEQPRPS